MTTTECNKEQKCVRRTFPAIFRAKISSLESSVAWPLLVIPACCSERSLGLTYQDERSSESEIERSAAEENDARKLRKKDKQKRGNSMGVHSMGCVTLFSNGEMSNSKQ